MKRTSVIVPKSNTDDFIKDGLLVEDKGLIFNKDKDEIYVRLKNEYQQVSGVIDNDVELVQKKDVLKVVYNEISKQQLKQSLICAPDFNGIQSKDITSDELKNLTIEKISKTLKYRIFDFFKVPVQSQQVFLFEFDCEMKYGNISSIEIEVTHINSLFNRKYFCSVQRNKIIHNKIVISIPNNYTIFITPNKFDLEFKYNTNEECSIIINNFKLHNISNSKIIDLSNINNNIEISRGVEIKNSSIFDNTLSFDKNGMLTNNYISHFNEGSKWTHSRWLKIINFNEHVDYNKTTLFKYTQYDVAYYDRAKDPDNIIMGFEDGEIISGISIPIKLLFNNQWHNITVMTELSKSYIIKSVYIDNVFIQRKKFKISIKEILKNSFLNCYTEKSPNIQMSLGNLCIFNRFLTEPEIKFLYENKQFPRLNFSLQDFGFSNEDTGILSQKIQEALDKISINTNTLLDIDEKLKKTNENLNKEKQKIIIIEERLNQNAESIASNERKINDTKSELKEEIKGIKEELELINTKITNNTQTINQNTTKINTVINNYNVLKNQVDLNMTNITKIKKAIIEMSKLIPAANTIIAVKDVSELTTLYPGTEGQWTPITP